MGIESFGNLGGFENVVDIKAVVAEVGTLLDKRKKLALGEYSSIRNDALAELDAEIRQKRFDVGLRILTQLNAKNTQWQLKEDRAPNDSRFFYAKKWISDQGDSEACVNFSADQQVDFFEDMRKVGEIIGDTELVDRMSNNPSTRMTPYNDIHINFFVTPKTMFKKPNTDTLPGLGLRKHFGSKEEHDTTEVIKPSLLISNTPCTIDRESEQKAKEEMIKLAHTLGIEGL